MNPIVYLNGQYKPLDQACISPLDRGFLFADGIYEVVRYYAARPVAMPDHLDRLRYSLKELRINCDESTHDLPGVTDELIRRNAMPDCYCYWQITRGAAERDHAFPQPAPSPTVFAYIKPQPALADRPTASPMTAITHDEIRWTRCAIKSVALLPNVLARQAAAEAGCDEAIFVRPHNHVVTEGTARSIFIVRGGELFTHPLDGTILGSVTRKLVIEFARRGGGAGETSGGIAVRQTPFTQTEMLDADECFAVGTTTEIRPVTHINHQPIADARPGPITLKLAAMYHDYIQDICESTG
ncbi:MAG: aminotransferase class IV [Phycisphaerales bacterium]